MVLVDDGLLGKGAQVGEPPQGLIALNVGMTETTEAAVTRISALAGRTVSTVPKRGQHHVVTHRAISDGRSDLHNDAGCLVPGDQRGGHVVLAVHATEVTAADTGRPDLDADLPRLQVRRMLKGVGQPDVLLAVALLDKALHGGRAPFDRNQTGPIIPPGCRRGQRVGRCCRSQ